MFPVDLPAVDDVTSASDRYLSALESRPPDGTEWFQSPRTSEVEITASNVTRLQLFDDDGPACVVLGLHPPDDRTRVVAVYLQEQWWSLDDVLRTSSGSRSGLVSVRSMVERVIVFLLSQVMERPPPEEALFSLHPRTESCKLLWSDGRAVGFYSVKQKGSLCDGRTSSCYLLPVLDTLLVRSSCRRRGFGLRILEDFCSSFAAEQLLGVSSPISASMVAVLRKFLQQHEEHRERLYEVEAPGGWTQRRNIWLNIQLGRFSSGDDKKSPPASGETQKNEPSEKPPPGPDLNSPSRCNLNAPPPPDLSAEQRVRPGGPSRGGPSPSSQISETGSGTAAAHAGGPDPAAPSKTRNTRQTLKRTKRLLRDDSQEIQRGEKRARRIRGGRTEPVCNNTTQ